MHCLPWVLVCLSPVPMDTMSGIVWEGRLEVTPEEDTAAGSTEKNEKISKSFWLTKKWPLLNNKE